MVKMEGRINVFNFKMPNEIYSYQYPFFSETVLINGLFSFKFL